MCSLPPKREKEREAGAAAPDQGAAGDDEGLSLEQVEKRQIERVLRRENGKVARAAEKLGVPEGYLEGAGASWEDVVRIALYERVMDDSGYAQNRLGFLPDERQVWAVVNEIAPHVADKLGERLDPFEEDVWNRIATAAREQTKALVEPVEQLLRDALAGAHFVATVTKNLLQERRRRVFEYWANAACAIPMEDYPLFEGTRRRYRRRYAADLASLRAVVRHVRARLESHGRDR